METAALVAPITALEFLGEQFLLTGEGPILTVHSLQPYPKASSVSLSVLQHYRIHGIHPRPLETGPPRSCATEHCWEQRDGSIQYDLVLFGGKAVRLVRLLAELRGGNLHLRLEALGPLMELHDWALDIRWLSGEGRPLLSVALAHNSALLLDAVAGKTLACCSCLEGCLLYSALLLVDRSWEESVLVGGTVFNQLVLWKPGGGEWGEPDHKAPVERRLLGHSGVIFSLSYLQDKGWLASASDDRSVRVWGVGVLGGHGGSCGDSNPTCLRVLYGHQARVFSVRLAPGKVFSAGEDGACLVWDWAGGGKVARTLKGHRAGGVRALAVSEGKGSDGGQGRWVATGGADGGLRLWRVEGDEERSEETKGDTSTETLTDLRFSGLGVPKVMCMVGREDACSNWGRNTVVVCTDQGMVYLYCDSQWELVWQGGPEFHSYCVMETLTVRIKNSPSEAHLCAVGSLSGGTHVFPVSHPNSGVRLSGGPGKIHSLIWVGGQDSEIEGGYLLASGAEGLVHRWYVEVEMGDDKSLVLRVEPLSPFLLPPCAKRWLTAAVHLRRRPQGALWVCGDRRGSLLLFQERGQEREREREAEEEEMIQDTLTERRKDGDDETEREEEGDKKKVTEKEREREMRMKEKMASPLQPVSCLFGVHGKQGVTWVSEYQGLLYSAGRDGCVRVFRTRPTPLTPPQGDDKRSRYRGVGGGSSGEILHLEVLRVQRACKGMEWLERVLILEPERSAAELAARTKDKEVFEKGHIKNDIIRTERESMEMMEKMEKSKSMKEEEEGEIWRGGQEKRESEGREARFVIAGFHAVHFVVWDPVRQERLLAVPCGGGHRSWSLWPPQNSLWLGHGTLVFIKQGAVLASQPPREALNQVGKAENTGGWGLREGLHGRGIGCVCRLGKIVGVGRGNGFQTGPRDGIEERTMEREERHWEILVTGGEDTSLTVLAVQPSSGTIQVLSVITDHISSVRTLTAVTRSEGGSDGARDRERRDRTTQSLSVLLISAGGRAQMQCYRLLIGWDGQGQVPSCQVIQVASHRLDEQWERRRNRHKTVKMDPETRYMSIAVVNGEPECVLLALACSDGAVRLFSVSEVKGRFDLLWESFHHQRCVLSVATCSLEYDEGNSHKLLFSAATDGKIAVWDLTTAASLLAPGLTDLPSPPTPCLTVPAHQSGVNSLAVWAERAGQQEDGCLVTVASGGDDGRLTVSVIRVQYWDGEVEGSTALSQPQDVLCKQQLNYQSSPETHPHLQPQTVPSEPQYQYQTVPSQPQYQYQTVPSQPQYQYQTVPSDHQTHPLPLLQPLHQTPNQPQLHPHIQLQTQPHSNLSRQPHLELRSQLHPRPLPLIQLHLLSQCHVPLAHAAPVTALGLLSPGLLVSTSPDQRVCLWRVCSTGIIHTGALYSHVADAAGLAVWVGESGRERVGGTVLKTEGKTVGETTGKTESETGERIRGETRGETDSETSCKTDGRVSSETISKPGSETVDEVESETRCRTDEKTDCKTRCETESQGWVVLCGQGVQLLRVRDAGKDGGMEKRVVAEQRVKVVFKTNKT